MFTSKVSHQNKKTCDRNEMEGYKLYGGQGADYFDCGEGVDVVIDFNLEEGDDNAGNCEEISTSANR